MTGNVMVQIALYVGVLLLLAKPLGVYMARVYEGQSSGLDRVLGPVERLFYRICGIVPDEEMDWKKYAGAVLMFSAAGFFFLYSLQRLQGLGRRAVLPGHGPELADLSSVAAMYLAHRQQRLEQVRQALRVLGEDATARQVVEEVYADVDEKLWDAAESSVRAQLQYLREN